MRRLLIVNLLLVAVLVAAGVRFHNDWLMFEATHQAGAIQPERETLPKLAPAPPPNSGAPSDWTEIPSRNPFSFDRTDVTILEPKAPVTPAGPKPILFGTMSLGKDQLALVASGQPGNRNYKPMKVGELIDGWTIATILDKSIVITANSTEETVIMNDPTAQVQRDHTRTLASAPSAAVPAAPPAPVLPLGSLTPVTPGAPTSPSAGGQGQPRRRVIQMTPFGPREIDEPQQ